MSKVFSDQREDQEPSKTMLALFLIIATVASIDGTLYDVTPATEWWQTTTLYQIWPRSFKDSDGDGIGDLNGITSRLEHLVDTGVEVLWLSPFYKSPMVDSGYDISDFRDVYPEYGTLEDFKNLVARAKELGLKVVLDFVPNHTSDEHEWFIQSKAGVEPYADYYIWNEGIIDANGTRQPPNNWLSVFNSGSAWEWVEERQAFYLHQFHEKQVDLNFRNPLVLQETKDIMTFWLDCGIDGFRIDSVPYLVEDEQLRDEPESGLPGYNPSDFYYLKHIYVKDQRENYDIVQAWKDHIDSYSEKIADGKVRIMFTEAYAVISSVVEYYNHGSQVPFNFFFLKDDLGIGNAVISTAKDVVEIINNWMESMPANCTANWVLGNHDNNRVATKYGVERVDGLNMMLYTLPGVAITYNGDEIGMTDTYLTWEETEDPQACNSDRYHYQAVSRDPVRTPYQWDDSTSAGFSTNPKTMLPVNENYLWLNLAAQKSANVSHYKNVQELIKLRKSSVIREGKLDVRVIEEKVIAYTRGLEGENPIVVLINWDRETDVPLNLEEFENLPDDLLVKIADVNSGLTAGDVYKKENILLPRNAAVLLEGMNSRR